MRQTKTGIAIEGSKGKQNAVIEGKRNGVSSEPLRTVDLRETRPHGFRISTARYCGRRSGVLLEDHSRSSNSGIRRRLIAEQG
jgi:hypothetical protein